MCTQMGTLRYASLEPGRKIKALANSTKEVNFMEKSDQKLIYGPSNTHCRSIREESSSITGTVKDNESGTVKDNESLIRKHKDSV